jgi:hypothetical protein
VARGKSGDEGHPLDVVTASFTCQHCGLQAMQYYRIELSHDRRSVILPGGVEMPCDFIDREVDARNTWIGYFPDTEELRVYVVESAPPERKPRLRDLQEG